MLSLFFISLFTGTSKGVPLSQTLFESFRPENIDTVQCGRAFFTYSPLLNISGNEDSLKEEYCWNNRQTGFLSTLVLKKKLRINSSLIAKNTEIRAKSRDLDYASVTLRESNNYTAHSRLSYIEGIGVLNLRLVPEAMAGVKLNGINDTLLRYPVLYSYDCGISANSESGRFGVEYSRDEYGSHITYAHWAANTDPVYVMQSRRQLTLEYDQNYANDKGLRLRYVRIYKAPLEREGMQVGIQGNAHSANLESVFPLFDNGVRAHAGILTGKDTAAVFDNSGTQNRWGTLKYDYKHLYGYTNILFPRRDLDFGLSLHYFALNLVDGAIDLGFIGDPMVNLSGGLFYRYQYSIPPGQVCWARTHIYEINAEKRFPFKKYHYLLGNHFGTLVPDYVFAANETPIEYAILHGASTKVSSPDNTAWILYGKCVLGFKYFFKEANHMKISAEQYYPVHTEKEQAPDSPAGEEAGQGFTGWGGLNTNIEVFFCF